MAEEVAFVLKEFVVAMVEGILWNNVRIHAEQVTHGALAIPFAVHIPFA